MLLLLLLLLFNGIDSMYTREGRSILSRNDNFKWSRSIYGVIQPDFYQDQAVAVVHRELSLAHAGFHCTKQVRTMRQFQPRCELLIRESTKSCGLDRNQYKKTWRTCSNENKLSDVNIEGVYFSSPIKELDKIDHRFYSIDSHFPDL